MNVRNILYVFLGLGVGLGVWGVSSFTTSSDTEAKLDPAKVADQIHAVIQANRTIYATHVVDKLQAKGIVTAAEYWKQEDVLPLPAQFLIETGRLVSVNGTGL